MSFNIRATLGSKLISNAATFFRNDIRAACDEILQNSRRAGATRVEFALRRGDLTLKDDGAGLAKEDAEILLALGSSANGGGVERDEAAAGIGFFALAHHTVHVRTQDWRCTITPQNFVGSGDVEIVDGLADAEGMEIRVEKFYTEVDLARQAVKDAVEYSGLAATLAVGKGAAKRLPGRQFLYAYDGREAFTGSRVAQLPGARLRVVRFRDEEEHRGVDDHSVFRFNFFGKTLYAGPDCSRLHGVLPCHDTFTVANGRGAFDEHCMRNMALVEVETTATVRLRLPDRDAVIDEARLMPLIEAAYELFVENMRGQPHGVIPEMPGLPKANIRIYGRGLGAEDLATRASVEDPSIAEIIDSDGFQVDFDSLVHVGRCGAIEGFVPHTIKLSDERLVRLVDIDEADGIVDLNASIGKISVLYESEGIQRLISAEFDNERVDVEMMASLREEHEGLDSLRCEQIEMRLTIEGGRPATATIALDAFAAAGFSIDLIGIFVLTTTRSDGAQLAEAAAMLATTTWMPLRGRHGELVDDCIDELTKEWRAVALAAAPDRGEIVRQVETAVRTALKDEKLDLTALDLTLRIAGRPLREDNIVVALAAAKTATAPIKRQRRRTAHKPPSDRDGATRARRHDSDDAADA